jgi:hypothetical protein
MKCNKCEKSFIIYDTSICAWVAKCDYLGTAKNISEYTENDIDCPQWDEDLGQNNTYCKHYNMEAL